jgi:hypothetical protein
VKRILLVPFGGQLIIKIPIIGLPALAMASQINFSFELGSIYTAI